MRLPTPLHVQRTTEEMTGRCFLLVLLLLVDGVFGADADEVSVLEGDSVTLNTGVTKQHHDKILWYYNDTRIALINGHPNTSCLYDGEDGIFRDRLKVDYESGSLNISDIRSEHTGRYEAELIRSESSGKRQSLNRNRKCDSTKITRKTSSTHEDTIKIFRVIIRDETNEEPRMEKRLDSSPGQSADGPGSGLSSAAVAGIVVAVLLVFAAAAAGVVYYHHRRSKNGGKRSEPVI